MFFRLVHIQFLCLLLSIVVILLYAKNAMNYPYSTVILFHEINASVFQPFIHYGILSHEIEPAGSQPPAPMKRHTWNSNHPDFLLLFPAAKFGRQPIPRLQSGNRLFGIAWWKARPRSVGCFFLLRIAPAASSYRPLEWPPIELPEALWAPYSNLPFALSYCFPSPAPDFADITY